MSDEQAYHMSRAHFEELRAELKHKVEVERKRLAKRLKAAIEMGDLSENAEYIAAKEEQAFLEGRIRELEILLRHAVIIEEDDGPNDVVRLGSTVTVVELNGSDAEMFTIVGKVEANPRQGKISNESPLGKALLGHKVGDVVHVQTPAGETAFKIVDIK